MPVENPVLDFSPAVKARFALIDELTEVAAKKLLAIRQPRPKPEPDFVFQHPTPEQYISPLWWGCVALEQTLRWGQFMSLQMRQPQKRPGAMAAFGTNVPFSSGTKDATLTIYSGRGEFDREHRVYMTQARAAGGQNGNDRAPGRSMLEVSMNQGYTTGYHVWESACAENNNKDVTVDDMDREIEEGIDLLTTDENGERICKGITVDPCAAGWLLRFRSILEKDRPEKEQRIAGSIKFCTPFNGQAGKTAFQDLARNTPDWADDVASAAWGGIIPTQAIKAVYDYVMSDARMDEAIKLFFRQYDKKTVERILEDRDWRDEIANLSVLYAMWARKNIFRDNKYPLGQAIVRGKLIDPAKETNPQVLVAGLKDWVVPPSQVFHDEAVTNPAHILLVLMDETHAGAFASGNACKLQPLFYEWMELAIEKRNQPDEKRDLVICTSAQDIQRSIDLLREPRRTYATIDFAALAKQIRF